MDSDTILVTGGAGYIGSQTCKALFKAGFFPVVYDNLSTGHAYAVKWGPLVIGDINDSERLHFAFSKYTPKAVLHFAASALVMESMADPGKYYRNNTSGSISLLNAMQKFNIPYLVFSSTCATYGHPQFSPITEEHPQNPISPYGKSKLMVEEIIADFSKSLKFNAVSLRYFNAAGADLESEIGENHTPETHLIPSVIEAALGIRKEIAVYGTDFDSPDGSAVRDYIHVEDLANAHVKALQWLLEKRQKSLFLNLGTGKGSSVLEIIKAVQKFSQKEISVRLEKRRLGEPSHLVASNKKAQEILGWSPSHSALPVLIESAWKWHEKQKNASPCYHSHSS